MSPLNARDRLIVALDVADVATAQGLVERLRGHVGVWKIGYQLGLAGGLELARDLVGSGESVFLDFKLHDIGSTVAKGVESAAAMGVSFLTVHAYPQVMRAAVEARGTAPLKLLAVTVLTSLDDADLREAGYAMSVEALVARRAAQAASAGIDGIVCAASEAARVRAAAPGLAIVTPGIRPAGTGAQDQKRVFTPGDALRAGIDYLVVGRPIVAAPDPAAAADAIVAEIEAAQLRA